MPAPRKPGRPRKSPIAAASPATPVPDPVNAPGHYRQGGIECIDAIRASMSKEQFIGYCKGNSLKYQWRFEHKGGVQDLEKARWYLNRMIEELQA